MKKHMLLLCLKLLSNISAHTDSGFVNSITHGLDTMAIFMITNFSKNQRKLLYSNVGWKKQRYYNAFAQALENNGEALMFCYPVI